MDASSGHEIKQIAMAMCLLVISVTPLIFVRTFGLPTAISGLAFGSVSGIFILSNISTYRHGCECGIGGEQQ